MKYSTQNQSSVHDMAPSISQTRFRHQDLLIASIMLTALLAVLTGCQFLQPPLQGEAAIDQPTFQRYVDDHAKCITSHNLFEIEAILTRLEQAPLPVSADQSPIPVPDFLKSLMGKPVSRLAVDPKALAASCNLHAGRLAMKQGDYPAARLLFSSLVQKYPESTYIYYVSQAYGALRDIPPSHNATTQTLTYSHVPPTRS